MVQTLSKASKSKQTAMAFSQFLSAIISAMIGIPH